MNEREQQPEERADPTSGSDDTSRSADLDGGAQSAADQRASEFDLRRLTRGLAAAERERAAEQREAAAEKRDQSQAEADRRTSIRRGAAGDRDQAAADRDQRASARDRDQAKTEHEVFDREQAAGYPRGAADGDRSRAQADQGARFRRGAAENRIEAVADRNDGAAHRHQSQAQADQRISNRDQAAGDRHDATSDRKHTASDSDVYQAAADERAANRDASARDREQAATDRRKAIADRAAGDLDYGEARDDLRRAQLDQLTGAFGREIGLLLLEREISRARDEPGQLVLAYVDVDGLKLVNDSQGHEAGDRLLRAVAGSIQTHLRAYDVLVRVGGDEFVCVFGDCTPAVVRVRFEEIRHTLRQTHPQGSISVGFAQLRSGDTLDELTKRGDVALYAAKRAR